MTIETIRLHHGPLEFTALTAGSGPLVLLLHGFPDTPYGWTPQITALAEAGFRAVAPFMRGYEPSSQPSDSDYHAIRMAEDVVAWADQLNGEAVHLVGHDWGANIAYAAAALAPERFASLTTLAVPHPVRFAEAYALSAEQQARSAYILAFQAAGFEAEVVHDDCAYLEALWRAWSPHWSIPADLLSAMRSCFAAPGVAQAALSYYRHAFDPVSEAGQATAALFARPIHVPTLGLCGAEDQCITADVFMGAMRPSDFPTALQVERIEGAGHFLHAERPDAVNAVLLKWLHRPS